MRTCQKCGAEVEKNDIYCPECGEKVVKEARKITLLTIFKIAGMVLIFIILFNVFKQKAVPSVAIILFLILLFIWTGILNSVLKKLFNAEISTGVKIVVTIVIALIFMIGMRQTSMTQIKIPPTQVMPVGGNDMRNFIGRLNDVVNAKDNNLLTTMIEEGVIAPEVAEDIRTLINSKNDFNINFKVQSQSVNDNKAEVKVITVIKTQHGERTTGLMFLFENAGPGWKLTAIQPRLQDIQLSTSFGEETASKIEKVKSAIICEPPKIMYQGECCLDADNSGVCDVIEEGQNKNVMNEAKKACTQYCNSNLCGLFVNPDFPQPELKGKSCLDLGVQCKQPDGKPKCEVGY